MSDKPMTAEEIRQEVSKRLLRSEDDKREVRAVIGVILNGLGFMCDWMAARESEHAELLARVERLEAKVMGDGR